MRAPARRTTLSVLVLVALAQGACAYRTRRDVQRDWARAQLPARLEPKAPATSPARPLAVRILADQDYRAELLRWSERIAAQIERANRVLEPQFGIRLVVKEVRPWTRAADARSRDLSAALAELEAAERGGDAAWVIGFVSSTGMVAGAPGRIGTARAMGSHLVVRGQVSSAEGDAYRATLDAVPESERDALLRERELHRETAILLHEWAHTLGAFHEKDPASLLSPYYAPSASAFSPVSARIIALGLARRASLPAGGDVEWASAYRAAVEAGRAAAWDAATVDDALGLASAVASGAARLPRPSAAPTEEPALAPRRPGDVAVLIEADASDRLGDPRRAWALVEPVAARLPDRGRLQAWACHLRRRAGQTFARGDRCLVAKPLSARAASILFAEVLVNEGDRGAALEILLRVEGALAAARPPAKAKEWASLAGVLARLDACTVAERAAARAPSQPEAISATAQCGRIRRRAALPRAGARVDAAREPEYVEAVMRGRGAAEAGRVAPARAAAAQVEAEFPDAPGGPLIRCLAEAQGGDPTAVRAACVAADEAAPFAAEPPHVLGLMAGDHGRWAEAREHLLRALARDEGDRDVWAHLATVHRKLGDGAAAEALDRRFRDRFGQPLRPAW